jgi:hypothetical protein
MSRTIARRIATIGGALGVAVLACAGTASAATCDSAHASAHSVIVYGGHPVSSKVTVVRDAEWGKKPCHHRGDRDRDFDRGNHYIR